MPTYSGSLRRLYTDLSSQRGSSSSPKHSDSESEDLPVVLDEFNTHSSDESIEEGKENQHREDSNNDSGPSASEPLRNSIVQPGISRLSISRRRPGSFTSSESEQSEGRSEEKTRHARSVSADSSRRSFQSEGEELHEGSESSDGERSRGRGESVAGETSSRSDSYSSCEDEPAGQSRTSSLGQRQIVVPKLDLDSLQGQHEENYEEDGPRMDQKHASQGGKAGNCATATLASTSASRSSSAPTRMWKRGWVESKLEQMRQQAGSTARPGRTSIEPSPEDNRRTRSTSPTFRHRAMPGQQIPQVKPRVFDRLYADSERIRKEREEKQRLQDAFEEACLVPRVEAPRAIIEERCADLYHRGIQRLEERDKRNRKRAESHFREMAPFAPTFFSSPPPTLVMHQQDIRDRMVAHGDLLHKLHSQKMKTLEEKKKQLEEQECKYLAVHSIHNKVRGGAPMQAVGRLYKEHVTRQERHKARVKKSQQEIGKKLKEWSVHQKSAEAAVDVEKAAISAANRLYGEFSARLKRRAQRIQNKEEQVQALAEQAVMDAKELHGSNPLFQPPSGQRFPLLLYRDAFSKAERLKEAREKLLEAEKKEMKSRSVHAEAQQKKHWNQEEIQQVIDRVAKPRPKSPITSPNHSCNLSKLSTPGWTPLSTPRRAIPDRTQMQHKILSYAEVQTETVDLDYTAHPREEAVLTKELQESLPSRLTKARSSCPAMVESRQSLKASQLSSIASKLVASEDTTSMSSSASASRRLSRSASKPRATRQPVPVNGKALKEAELASRSEFKAAQEAAEGVEPVKGTARASLKQAFRAVEQEEAQRLPDQSATDAKQISNTREDETLKSTNESKERRVSQMSIALQERYRQHQADTTRKETGDADQKRKKVKSQAQMPSAGITIKVIPPASTTKASSTDNQTVNQPVKQSEATCTNQHQTMEDSQTASPHQVVETSSANQQPIDQADESQASEDEVSKPDTLDSSIQDDAAGAETKSSRESDEVATISQTSVNDSNRTPSVTSKSSNLKAMMQQMRNLQARIMSGNSQSKS